MGVAKAAGVALTDLQGAQLRLAVGVVESAGGRGFGKGGGSESFWGPRGVFGVPKGFWSLAEALGFQRGFQGFQEDFGVPRGFWDPLFSQGDLGSPSGGEATKGAWPQKWAWLRGGRGQRAL